jgi:Carboxypeptidase regulatory-like domain
MFSSTIRDLLRGWSPVFCLALAMALSGIRNATAQQDDNAIVVGTVYDPTHAAIAGATVTLTHVSTNAVTEVHIGMRGEYRTPPLKIGEYTVDFQAEGFKQSKQSGIVLEIADVRQVDGVLDVGQTSESVSVDAEAPLLQTSAWRRR